MNSDLVLEVIMYSGFGFIVAMDAIGVFTIFKYAYLGIKKLVEFIKKKAKH